MPATIIDVAQKAGVSPTTVSRVLNRPELVKEATRQRVLIVARELGFVPNALARRLVGGHSGIVALVVPQISNPFFSLVANGCDVALQHTGVAVALVSTSESTIEEDRIRGILSQRLIDGLIYVSSAARDAGPTEPDPSESIPTVFIQREPESELADAVCVDDREGGRMACNYLLQLGHRRIAIVTGTLETLAGRLRFESFRDCLHENGISLPDEYVISGNFTLESGKNAAEQLLNCKSMPTAVFVSSDLMAYAFMHALVDAGLRVPDDLSVIGFDDLPMSSLFYPTLTTIWSPKKQLGAAASRLMAERLQNPALPSRVEVLPVELIVRDSCSAI